MEIGEERGKRAHSCPDLPPCSIEYGRLIMPTSLPIKDPCQSNGIRDESDRFFKAQLRLMQLFRPHPILHPTLCRLPFPFSSRRDILFSLPNPLQNAASFKFLPILCLINQTPSSAFTLSFRTHPFPRTNPVRIREFEFLPSDYRNWQL